MSDMSNWAQFFQAYNDYNERCADLLEGRYTYLLGTTPLQSEPILDREGSAILLDKSLVGYDFNNLQLWVRQLDKDLTSSIDNIDKVNKDIEEIKTIENNYLQRIQSLQTKTAEIDGLKATLESHSNSLTELENQYNNLSERVAQNEENIEYLKNKVDEAITNLNTALTGLDNATKADITVINNTLESHTISEGSWTPPDAPLTALVQNEQVVFTVPLAAIVNATRVVAEGTVTVYYQGQWFSIPLAGKSTSSFSSLGIVCHVDATGVTANGNSFPTDTTGIAIASSKTTNGILFKFS